MVKFYKYMKLCIDTRSAVAYLATSSSRSAPTSSVHGSGSEGGQGARREGVRRVEGWSLEGSGREYCREDVGGRHEIVLE